MGGPLKNALLDRRAVELGVDGIVGLPVVEPNR
jgi:hypothetical protein